MSGRDIAFAAFTDRGAALAERLHRGLGGTLTRIGAGQGISLENWTRDAFQTGCQALVFVGAVGVLVGQAGIPLV